MADFRLKDGEQVRTVIAKKDSATVIEPGDMVAISSGLVIKATAASAKIAWCPAGAGAGETDVSVTIGSDFTLLGTADANFAVANRAAEVDLVVNTGVQQIDLGASATDVFIVGVSETSGVAGSAENVEVRINPTKVLF